MADTATLVKDKLPIQEVIGSYIKLEKAGINFKARCPFHQEKTPSFFISPTRNTFYCFGCGAKGDIFEFVERIEGLDFIGALRMLAEKAGIEIESYSGESKGEREKLFALIEEATKFFEHELSKSPGAMEYLISRGLKEETIKHFRIGYAPASWRGLSSHLEGIGFKPIEIEKSGLSKPGNKGNYDRFRGRIMFPIFDTGGRIVAYSGRIFDSSVEGEGITPAKYVNSPETELYHKSKILYGMNFAKEGIRKWTFGIVVEGQMDLVMSHQAGFTNTVALSGTALTEDQLTTLSRFTDKILLSLDADAAGVSAAGKSAMLALSHGFDVKVAHLRGGKDPADIIKENPDNWKEIVKKSTHIIEYYLSVIAERNLDQRKFRLEVVKLVFPFLKQIKSAVDRAHFISIIARRLEIPEGAITEELRNFRDDSVAEVRSLEVKKDEPTILSKRNRLIQTLIGIWKSSGSEEVKKEIETKLKEKIEVEEFEKLVNNESFVNEAAFNIEEIERLGGQTHNTEQLFDNLEVAILKDKEKILRDKIKLFELEKKEIELESAMKEYQLLANLIHKLEDKIRSSNAVT